MQRKKKQGQNWYDLGRWTELTDQPEEVEMWDWLDRFQTEFLSTSPSMFCVARNPRELTGAEAKRQLDVLMKRRADWNSNDERRHDWKDMRVIGELKQSEQDFNPLLLQLRRYSRDVITAQPTRRFLPAFIIQGRVMEAWIFDRSGAYNSGKFDIHKEPEKFIKLIIGYANMSDAELGLDTYIEQKGTDPFISVSAGVSGEGTTLQLEKSPFVKQRATVCQGPACFRTSDEEKVVKFSWTTDKQHCESKLLQLAHEMGVEGIAEFVGDERLTTIDKLRTGMTFPSPHRFRTTTGSVSGSFSVSRSFGAFRKLSVSSSKSNSRPSKLRQQSQAGQSSAATSTSLYETDSSKCSNRIFECSAILPAGRALRSFTSAEELLTALRDAIIGHRSLYLNGGILHLDISENNIVITDPSKLDTWFFGDANRPGSGESSW